VKSTVNQTPTAPQVVDEQLRHQVASFFINLQAHIQNSSTNVLDDSYIFTNMCYYLERLMKTTTGSVTASSSLPVFTGTLETSRLVNALLKFGFGG